MQTSPGNPITVNAVGWVGNGTSAPMTADLSNFGQIQISSTAIPEEPADGTGEIVVNFIPAEGYQVTNDGNQTKIVIL